MPKPAPLPKPMPLPKPAPVPLPKPVQTLARTPTGNALLIEHPELDNSDGVFKVGMPADAILARDSAAEAE